MIEEDYVDDVSVPPPPAVPSDDDKDDESVSRGERRLSKDGEQKKASWRQHSGKVAPIDDEDDDEVLDVFPTALTRSPDRGSLNSIIEENPRGRSLDGVAGEKAAATAKIITRKLRTQSLPEKESPLDVMQRMKERVIEVEQGLGKRIPNPLHKGLEKFVEEGVLVEANPKPKRSIKTPSPRSSLMDIQLGNQQVRVAGGTKALRDAFVSNYSVDESQPYGTNQAPRKGWNRAHAFRVKGVQYNSDIGYMKRQTRKIKDAEASILRKDNKNTKSSKYILSTKADKVEPIVNGRYTEAMKKGYTVEDLQQQAESNIPQQRRDLNNMHGTFSMLDRQAQGMVDVDDIKQSMKEFGFIEREIDIVLEGAMLDADRRLDSTEFVNIFTAALEGKCKNPLKDNRDNHPSLFRKQVISPRKGSRRTSSWTSDDGSVTKRKASIPIKPWHHIKTEDGEEGIEIERVQHSPAETAADAAVVRRPKAKRKLPKRPVSALVMEQETYI